MRGAYGLSAVLVLVVAFLSLLWLNIESKDGQSVWPLDAGVPLRIGYAIEEPFVSLDAHGQITGEAPEVLKQALNSVGVERAVWMHVEFGQLLHELKAGRIDIVAAGMFITPERTAQVQFSRPTIAVRTGLLLRVDVPAPDRLHQWSQQPARRLAVIRGAVEAQLAREAGLTAAQIVPYPDALSAFTAVRNRSADAFALSMVSLRGLLASTADPGLRVVPLTQEGHAGLPAYAFRHADRALRDRVDAALAAYLGSPAHRNLARRFGFDDTDVDLALAWSASRAREER